MALRQEVFILEQRCFYVDADHFDIDAYHLRVLEEKEKSINLVAYLRVILIRVLGILAEFWSVKKGVAKV